MKSHNHTTIFYRDLKRFAQKAKLYKVARQTIFTFHFFDFFDTATAADAALLRFLAAAALSFFC
jgi:hypothetical protein